jgi:hypothetical protein
LNSPFKPAPILSSVFDHHHMQSRIRRDLAIVTSNKDKVRRVKLIDNIFFSIGAMKAGTSWLYEALRLNPDINAVPIKEVHYLWHRFGTFQLLSREQRR